MARVGRLAGALLAETEGEFYLVGDLKEPCDFAAAGFESPGQIDVQERLYLKLKPLGEIKISSPVLLVETEGEALAKLLAERLVIARNGSVSERIWRMLVQSEKGSDGAHISARWLAEMPFSVWQIVKDNILKCS